MSRRRAVSVRSRVFGLGAPNVRLTRGTGRAVVHAVELSVAETDIGLAPVHITCGVPLELDFSALRVGCSR